MEVAIAATIMLGGLLALGGMLGHAATATSTTKAREQGVSLQRELVEAARAIPYDKLDPGSVVSLVQSAAASGLADASTSSGWTVRRRGVTYGVTLGVCSVDDPADGLGVHDPAAFCASGTGAAAPAACTAAMSADGSVQGNGSVSGGAVAGDCGLDFDLDGSVDGLTEASAGGCVVTCAPSSVPDKTPDDYKRIVTLVTWDRGTGKRYALQSTTVSNPGLSSAPVVQGLATTAADPVTSATSVFFTATTDRAPQTVSWYVDGTHVGTATGAGTSWEITWNLGTVSSGSTPNSDEVLDGSYVVGARAFDEYGTASHVRSRTVRINRRAPYPPRQFQAGRNGAGVDFEWTTSPERDVEGYRVYRKPPSEAAVEVCALTQATTCHDAAPPAIASIDYYVVAVDRDAAGSLREGTPSPIDSVGQSNTAPQPPTGLVASSHQGNTVLVWQASPGDPDSGDAVDHYRIYRDGTAFADRYDRTQTAQQLTFTDTRTNGLTHTYRVVAVDGNLAESTMLGPVTR